MFRSKLAEDIFNQKYKHDNCETWSDLAKTLVLDVCGEQLSKEDQDQLIQYISDMKFIPGGRYLYYAGRPIKFFNNCYLLRAEEDSREDWANLSWKSESCLLTGGGIGVDYSVYRQEGATIKRTGGGSSGPIPKMEMVNEIGRRVLQGGSRRSAIYASLGWQHGDILKFLKAKNWDYVIPGTDKTIKDVKLLDFNFPAPLDMTNISVNYDTDWLMQYYNSRDRSVPGTTGVQTGTTNGTPEGETFKLNVRQALQTGEPGFSFNFFEHERETLRNACTEVCSADDSDVCNLGSLNFSRIEDIEELRDVTTLAIKFLLCGTLKADVPYNKVGAVRAKNRRLGLGLMGVHEWLVQRGHKYEVTPELHQWLTVYKGVSERASREFADHLSISRPVANRAIAPTGTIGLIAGTTTGIEPVYAVAYKRRYLVGSTKWKHQYAVDYAAREIIDRYGTRPEDIESSSDLARDPERRIKFQADVQDYVDMSISSTINLPAWGTEFNNEDKVESFSRLLASYASRLRGFTCYPDGSRGGQPLTAVPYREAIEKLGEEFDEHVEFNDVCDIKGGTCGS